MTDQEELTTYLNDHHSGAAGARDLVEKSAANNEATPLGAFLSGLLTASKRTSPPWPRSWSSSVCRSRP